MTGGGKVTAGPWNENEASIIAEAFSAYEATGLTPRQLAVDALESALTSSGRAPDDKLGDRE